STFEIHAQMVAEDNDRKRCQKPFTTKDTNDTKDTTLNGCLQYGQRLPGGAGPLVLGQLVRRGGQQASPSMIIEKRLLDCVCNRSKVRALDVKGRIAAAFPRHGSIQHHDWHSRGQSLERRESPPF